MGGVMTTPVFGVTGWKNSGKTTLVTRLVSEFSRRGLRVSTVKHAHHDFDIDKPATDSFRHREAGASEVLIVSGRRWALMHELRGDAEPPLLEERDLAPDELAILRHAEKVLERRPFMRHFWGFLPQATPGGASCVMPNGPHVGNRVGFVQGGILLGLGAATASAALPDTWLLSAITAAFISPGQGPALEARASLVHQGQRVATVRTEVRRSDGRRVLEAMSTHLAK